MVNHCRDANVSRSKLSEDTRKTREKPSRIIRVKINENKPVEILIATFRVFEGLVQTLRNVRMTPNVTLSVRIRTIRKRNIINLANELRIAGFQQPKSAVKAEEE